MAATATQPDLFDGLGQALGTDYMSLREELTDDQLDLLRRVRAFVDGEVLPGSTTTGSARSCPGR
jgi:hypothetical protein